MTGGTLLQLKVLLNRTYVPKKPDENMKAAEDFLEIVVKAHIVAAANSISEHMAIASVHGIRTFLSMLSPTNLNPFQLSKDVGGRIGEVTGTEQLEDIGETAKVERENFF